MCIQNMDSDTDCDAHCCKNGQVSTAQYEKKEKLHNFRQFKTNLKLLFYIFSYKQKYAILS